MRVKAEVNAYLMDHQANEFSEALQNQEYDEVIDALMYSTIDMSEYWTPMGRATIEIDLPDENEIKAAMVETLRNEKSKVLANAQAEANRIDDKINQLLAIDWDGEQK